jgi:hypothetical protein
MKSTQEEMLTWVDDKISRTYLVNASERKNMKMLKAIRSLIVKILGEFYPRLKVINANGCCDGDTQMFLDELENFLHGFGEGK